MKTIQLFLFDLFNLFSRPIEIRKDKIPAVISCLVNRHPAADVVKKHSELGLT